MKFMLCETVLGETVLSETVLGETLLGEEPLINNVYTWKWSKELITINPHKTGARGLKIVNKWQQMCQKMSKQIYKQSARKKYLNTSTT